MTDAKPSWKTIATCRLREARGERIPFIFSSPHSGDHYPEDFLAQSRLSAREIRLSEDFLVHELFAAAPLYGAPLLRARLARAFLDLNREPYELDPSIFVGAPPPHANAASIGVSLGLGTIARLVAANKDIYREPLTYAEAEERIRACYFPYHRRLRQMMEETRRAFGFAILIDCHSMPSRHSGREGWDFVIGDRHGASAAPSLSEKIGEILSAMDYRVSFNRPYSGGFITKYYGRPPRRLHALQIEINRALYMDEEAIAPHQGFETLKENLRRFVAEIAALPRSFYDGFLSQSAAREAL